MGKPRFRQLGNSWVCDHNGYRYVFEETRFNLMVKNYRLGGCHISDKGLRRYAEVWGLQKTKYGGDLYGRCGLSRSYRRFWPDTIPSGF